MAIISNVLALAIDIIYPDNFNNWVPFANDAILNSKVAILLDLCSDAIRDSALDGSIFVINCYFVIGCHLCDSLISNRIQFIKESFEHNYTSNKRLIFWIESLFYSSLHTLLDWIVNQIFEIYYWWNDSIIGLLPNASNDHLALVVSVVHTVHITLG